MIKKNYFLLFLAIVVLFATSSCSKYQKLLKSGNFEAKYQAAVKYYNEGDFYRSLFLFEELITIYKGTKKAEDIYKYYAYCHYGQKDYDLASFHFQNYANTFPNAADAEECQFMAAYCHYLDSPSITLDQENTNKAIKEFQLFLNKYPNTSKKQQCNDLIDMLREKLQKKEYLNAKIYFDMGDYKAAVIAFKNLIKDYPGTKYREECLFLTVKSYYLYAKNSIEEKKLDRYKEATQAYYALVDAFPQSKLLKEAELIFNDCNRSIEKLQNTNTSISKN